MAARLLLATNNAGKVRELSRLLAGCGFEIVTPADLGLVLDVEEDGATYRENAARKARAFAAASGLPVLADDSGLEVDALGGEPGVQSARFGGSGLADAGRAQALLGRMAGIPPGQRTARYRAVVAVLFPGEKEPALFEAVQEGAIATAPAGSGGFGYDPVFLADGGRTAAELTPAEKDRLSHRGQACRLAAAYLRERAA